jgi:hypothetical protein
MKAIYGTWLLLCAPLVLAQIAPTPVDLSNPEAFGTRKACRTACQQVFDDCKAQCGDTNARAHERHYESPDLPVGGCIEGCSVNLRLCNEDC